MTLEAGIFDHLKSDADIKRLAGDRIFPHIAPQDASTPYIVFSRVSTTPLHHMRGVTDSQQVRVTITCWADTYSEAKACGQAIRMACDGFVGRWGDTKIHASLLEDMGDDFIPAAGNEEQRQYGSTLDMLVWHVLDEVPKHLSE